jgi:protein SCO1/2
MRLRSRAVTGVALALLIAGGGAAAALMRMAEQPLAENARPGSISIGGPFRLTASTGGTVTERTYRGKWLLICFGCADCSDAGSAALQAMSRAIEKLGPAAARVQALFITLDPKRDTPGVLAKHLKPFDPRIVGLTGTPAQIARIAKEYRVYHRPEKSLGGDYVIEHNSFIYLVDPRGELAKLFPESTPGILIGREVQRMLNESSTGRPPTSRAFFAPPPR